VNGCDSIVTTDLTIRPQNTFTQTPAPLCYGDSVVVNGIAHMTTGVFVDTLRHADVNGCDSIVTTNLTVYPLDTVTQIVDICFGQTYTIGTHTYNVSGTYIDTFYAGNVNGCDSIVTTVLTIHPLPVVNLGANVTQCGGSVRVDAGNPGSTFIWSDGVTSQIDTISTSGYYTVTVTTVPWGCVDSGSKTIYIKPTPVVNLGPDRTLCADSTILDAGNPGFTYVWTGGATTQFLTVTTSGQYTVTVTDSSSSCTASSSINVTLNSAPVVDLGRDTTLCGGPLTLDAGNAGAIYEWSDGSTGQTLNVTSTGNYSVTVSIPGGCSAVDSRLVVINPAPNLGADVTDSICIYNKANLYDYYINSGLTLTYSTPAPSVVGPGVYTIVGTNSNGCSDTAAVTIVGIEPAGLGPDRTDSVCLGGTFDLTTLYPNIGYTVYTWNTANPTAVEAGSYQLIASTGFSCNDTVLVTIINRVRPSLGPDLTDSVCPGYTTDLTRIIPDLGYATYVWNTTTPTAVGAGVYQLIVTNAAGCTDTAFVTVTNRAKPVVTIPSYANVCITEPAFALTGGLPAGGAYSIDGTAQTSFNPAALGAGVHHVLYVFTNASGCTDSASHDVTVYPRPKISTTPIPDVCTGTPVVILANHFTPAGGTFTGIGVSGNYFYPNNSPIGTQTITYIYVDPNGCSDTATNTINVIPAVQVTIKSSKSDYTICRSDSITFTAGGAEFYEFFVNGVSVAPASTTNTFTTYSLANHDEVTVVGSNACSTDTSAPIIIDVITPPVASAGNDTTIDLGQPVVLQGSGSGTGLLLYSWSPAGYLTASTIPNPTYIGSDSLRFTLTVSDTHGCIDTASVNVYVKIPETISFSNYISPNGDGLNDVWKIDPHVDLTGAHLVIFNRWGITVYQGNDYGCLWKGLDSSTGQPLPDGTYYFVLTLPSQKNKEYTGAINLFK
jgi:gliding motility-associated-like protein